MNIQRFSGFVWLMCLALSVARYFASISPALSDSFKLAYNIAVFALMYAFITFENWRLETSGINYKEKLREMGVTKK